MDKFLEKFYDLCKEHKNERQMAHFIRMTLPAINQVREDKRRFVAEFKDLISASEPLPVTAAPGEKKVMKEIVFTAADFESPKMQAQVAPPVAIEKSGAVEHKSDEKEKMIFELFNAGEAGAEDMGLAKFITAAKACGCEMKKQPKDIAEAWKLFEKYARQALQI